MKQLVGSQIWTGRKIKQKERKTKKSGQANLLAYDYS
jgi:hypothetical protein